MRPRWTVALVAVVGLSLSYTGPTGAQGGPAVPAAPDARTVTHVLNRLGFGPRPGDVDRVKAIGLAAYIEQQLHPERLEDPALEARLASFETLHLDTQQVAREYIAPVNQLRRQQQARQARMQAQAGGDAAMTPPATPAATPDLAEARRRAQLVNTELMQAKMLRGVLSERQLEEVLVDFWFNHFNVFIGKGQVRQYVTEYERDAIRPHVLGRFRDMLGASAHSPAMLFYLDNFQSQAPEGATVLAPERDVRRGRGRGGTDITRVQPPRAGQRGVQVRPPQIVNGRGRPNPLAGQPQPPNPNPTPQRRPRGLNENYARELMELHTLGVDGGYTQQDVVEVARILTGWTIDRPQQGGSFVFRPQVHDAGAKTVLGVSFPAGRGEDEGERLLDMLASHPSTARHIAYKLSQRFVADEPPPALVERAARTFLETDGDLRAVTRVIVTSPELFSADAYRAKVKTPLEFVISAARAAGATIANPQPMIGALRELGMPLYGAQPPTGYSMTADAWVNTGALLARMNYATQLVSGGQPVRTNQDVGMDADMARPNARAQAQAQAARARQARGPIRVDIAGLAPDTSEASRDRLIALLLAGDASEATRATLARAETPEQLVALVLGSPEFQRR
jgi:uncharacterized protein (DUF1800 family)